MILLRRNSLILMLAISWAGTSSCLAAADHAAAARVISVSGTILIRSESGAKDAKGKPAKVGDTIFKDDVINTASDALLKLLFTDRTIIDIGPSTLFKVQEYALKGGSDRNVQMNMDYGKIRSSVNTPVGNRGKFLIRTKTTTMGVRGTEFIVAADFQFAPPAPGDKPGSRATSVMKTEITVVKGKVDVEDKGAPRAKPVSLTQGQQLRTSAALSGDKVIPNTNAGGGGANSGQRGSAGGAGSVEAPKVVTLSQTQLTTLVSESKVADRSFTNAVVLEGDKSDSQKNEKKNQNEGPKTEGGKKDGPKEGNSNSTLSVIQEAVTKDNAAPAVETPPANIPGGPTTGPVAFQSGPSTQGAPVKVTITFTK